MPFDDSVLNPRLIKEYLTVEYQTPTGRQSTALDLNTVLGISDGKLKWGGKGFFSSARNLSLNGSNFSCQFLHGGRWLTDRIDLSLHIRLKNGKLETYKLPLDNPATPGTPPPAYPQESFSFTSKSEKFEKFEKSSEYRRSFYFKQTVAVDKLNLKGSVLTAQCLQSDGVTYTSSTLDLNDHISIVNGKLVWGGKGGFSSECQFRLEQYILKATCTNKTQYNGVASEIDLARYLQSYDGVLGLKVSSGGSAISDIFSLASWMKLKVVTEPDASVIIGNTAFKDAFSQIGLTTSKHVISEMTQELTTSVTKDVEATLSDKIKAELVTIVTDSVTKDIRAALELKIDAAFAAAKTAVLEACNATIDEAVKKVTIQCTESIIGPVGSAVVTQCNNAIANAVSEVTKSSIEHFQERVEIMMEKEFVAAAIRRAHTEAAFLSLMQASATGTVF